MTQDPRCYGQVITRSSQQEVIPTPLTDLEIIDAVYQYSHDAGCAVAIATFRDEDQREPFIYHFRSGPSESPKQVEEYAECHRLAVRRTGWSTWSVRPCPMRKRAIEAIEVRR